MTNSQHYAFYSPSNIGKSHARIPGTANNWQFWDSYFWAGTSIFLGNLPKSLYGTATFSGIAFWDSSSEISQYIAYACFRNVVCYENSLMNTEMFT